MGDIAPKIKESAFLFLRQFGLIVDEIKFVGDVVSFVGVVTFSLFLQPFFVVTEIVVDGFILVDGCDFETLGLGVVKVLSLSKEVVDLCLSQFLWVFVVISLVVEGDESVFLDGPSVVDTSVVVYNLVVDNPNVVDGAILVVALVATFVSVVDLLVVKASVVVDFSVICVWVDSAEVVLCLIQPSVGAPVPVVKDDLIVDDSVVVDGPTIDVCFSEVDTPVIETVKIDKFSIVR